jgi:hypothetical protein
MHGGIRFIEPLITVLVNVGDDGQDAEQGYEDTRLSSTTTRSTIHTTTKFVEKNAT